MNRFWRSRLGALLILIGLAAATAGGGVFVRVDQALSPARQDQTPPDFEAMRMRVEDVRFQATDGIELVGWRLDGKPAAPPIVLCHDLGASKRSMVNLAIDLHRVGFSVLLFDFRGHGESEGERTSLGLLEKRDVLGALDYLAQRGGATHGQVGVFGAGMGAHAAILAAAERRGATVLVLDGLYPDPAYLLIRQTLPNHAWARRGLGFLAEVSFTLLHGSTPRSEQASRVVGGLWGRDLLLLAPAADAPLMGAMRSMVQAIPDQADVDGNLVVVPATLSEQLYGEQLARYHERVTAFFTDRLVASEATARR